MTKQPEALLIADEMDDIGEHQVAAELRRLHQSEKEGWRYAAELEHDRKRLHEVNVHLVDALNEMIEAYQHEASPNNPSLVVARAAIAIATGEQQ